MKEEVKKIGLRNFERSTMLAEIKAVYRSKRGMSDRKSISTARDAADYFRMVWDDQRLNFAEEFLMICLNGGHQSLGWVKVSSGGFNAAVVDPRVVFSIALQTASSAIIIGHNHPSGGLIASPDDIEVTRKLREAGNLLDIKLLDHIILTRDSYYSLAEHSQV